MLDRLYLPDCLGMHAILQVHNSKAKLMQDFIAERAEGTYVWTTDGQKHLDMACGELYSTAIRRIAVCPAVCNIVCNPGIGVASTGHCHPKVVKAIQDQTQQFIIAQQNIFTASPAMVTL